MPPLRGQYFWSCTGAPGKTSSRQTPKLPRNEPINSLPNPDDKFPLGPGFNYWRLEVIPKIVELAIALDFEWCIVMIETE